MVNLIFELPNELGEIIFIKYFTLNVNQLKKITNICKWISKYSLKKQNFF